MMQVEQVPRTISRGLKAGLLTFFAGPPVGGFFYGLLLLGPSIVLNLTGQASDSTVPSLPLLEIWLVWILWSFYLVWVPAAITAVYVAVRIAATGQMRWFETVVLAFISLYFMKYGPPDFVSKWKTAMSFFPFSLLAALTLRFVAGQTGLAK